MAVEAAVRVAGAAGGPALEGERRLRGLLEPLEEMPGTNLDELD